MAEFDPSRAKPETVRAFLEASLTPIAGSRFTELLFELRDQCRIPLRTQTIVDRELLAAARLYYRTIHGTGVTTGAITKEMHADLTRLALEEPDSGPSSVDAADGDGPLPPSAPVSPAGAAYSQAMHKAVLEIRAHVMALEQVVNNSNIIWDGPASWLAGIPIFGPPGAAAAKESSDTTAAAPAGPALEDPEPCGCEEADALRERLRSAENELRRLGYGIEPIFVFVDDGVPKFTSLTGDACWDTALNRRRTFDFIRKAKNE